MACCTCGAGGHRGGCRADLLAVGARWVSWWPGRPCSWWWPGCWRIAAAVACCSWCTWSSWWSSTSGELVATLGLQLVLVWWWSSCWPAVACCSSGRAAGHRAGYGVLLLTIGARWSGCWPCWACSWCRPGGGCAAGWPPRRPRPAAPGRAVGHRAGYGVLLLTIGAGWSSGWPGCACTWCWSGGGRLQGRPWSAAPGRADGRRAGRGLLHVVELVATAPSVACSSWWSCRPPAPGGRAVGQAVPAAGAGLVVAVLLAGRCTGRGALHLVELLATVAVAGRICWPSAPGGRAGGQAGPAAGAGLVVAGRSAGHGPLQLVELVGTVALTGRICWPLRRPRRAAPGRAGGHCTGPGML